MCGAEVNFKQEKNQFSQYCRYIKCIPFVSFSYLYSIILSINDVLEGKN